MMNQSETSTVNADDSVSISPNNEVKAASTIKDNVWSCFTDIEPFIYFAERLVQGFREQYFDMRPEIFEKDKLAQANLIYNYEFMSAQLFAISDMLFNIRLKCEFISGDKSDRIIAAHIRNEAEMQSWLEDDKEHTA